METASFDVTRHLGGLRAYRPEEVDQFVSQATTERNALVEALALARAELDAARADLADRDDLRGRLGELVLEAQRTAASRRAAANAEVASVVAAAEAQADTLLAGAREEASVLRTASSAIDFGDLEVG